MRRWPNDQVSHSSEVGLLGKLGRLFAIGPREFGYHPTSKAFAFTNRIFLQASGFMLHRYSVLKYSTFELDQLLGEDIT